ncbi:MAG TPA: YciI family protein [bacterium]|nr:YciI family protein [bacterium]
MKYMLLIYFDEKVLEKIGKAEEEKIETECLAYMNQLQAQGKFLASNRLQPVSTATCVRTQDGKKIVTDGPFAETREQLGGFTMIDAKDLDEAIEIASKVGPGRLGTIEIRPILEFGQF